MFWIGEDGYRERISINEAIKRIRKRGRGKCWDLTRNPYNPWVSYPLTMRIDFPRRNNVGRRKFETIILEELTPKERRMIKKEVGGG